MLHPPKPTRVLDIDVSQTAAQRLRCWFEQLYQKRADHRALVVAMEQELYLAIDYRQENPTWEVFNPTLNHNSP